MVAIVGAAETSKSAPRILLVKTTSLGDVVHNLPVVNDLRRHFPDAHIDWLVEESFAAIPRLHPGVDQVFAVAVRRWRKHPFSQATWAEIKRLKHVLRQDKYDLILDNQGLLKSAVLTHLAHGERHGYDCRSILHEPFATLLYDKRHKVSRKLHAVERNRALTAAAFAYTADTACNYGIQALPLQADWLPAGAPYAVLLTATSRDDKLWPEAHWTKLGQALAAQGVRAVLPGGSAKERERAIRIAAAIKGIAAPALDIPSLAQLIAGARFVVGVDTGLTHLGAALGRPTLAIFCATQPGLTGVYADSNAINLGDIGQVPSPEQVLKHCGQWL